MSRSSSSVMSGCRSSRHPTQPEIIETNPMRDVRRIYWCRRWLNGMVGNCTKVFCGLDQWRPGKQPRETQMHWALRIGPYLYELLTDENMNIRWRYVDERQGPAWTPVMADRDVGYTSATDTELANTAKETISHMEGKNTSPDSPKAKYNLIKNNCQTFVLLFLTEVTHSRIKASGLTGTEAKFSFSESRFFSGLFDMEVVSSQNSSPLLIPLRKLLDLLLGPNYPWGSNEKKT